MSEVRAHYPTSLRFLCISILFFVVFLHFTKHPSVFPQFSPFFCKSKDNLSTSLAILHLFRCQSFYKRLRKSANNKFCNGETFCIYVIIPGLEQDLVSFTILVLTKIMTKNYLPTPPPSHAGPLYNLHNYDQSKKHHVSVMIVSLTLSISLSLSFFIYIFIYKCCKSLSISKTVSTSFYISLPNYPGRYIFINSFSTTMPPVD